MRSNLGKLNLGCRTPRRDMKKKYYRRCNVEIYMRERQGVSVELGEKRVERAAFGGVWVLVVLEPDAVAVFGGGGDLFHVVAIILYHQRLLEMS